jgi:hypothetical protein
MSAPLIVAVLLGLAVAWGVWRVRVLRRSRIAAQLVAALFLFLTLFPPATHRETRSHELIVLTPGVTSTQLAALPSAATIVALPGVTAPRSIERAPDLGTALRRHADAQHLRVVGGGLPLRDRDVARGHVSRFDAAPLPRGLVELELPPSVLAGHPWTLRGRAEQLNGGRAELRDPSGTLSATQPLDAAGRFVLAATAKVAGTALYTLKLFDRDGLVADAAAVPLAARAGTPMTILLLAGAPDADLKYLRRWAVDAGLRFDSRIALSRGVALIEGRPAFDAEALRAADLVILDERSWATLDARRKTLLRVAVRAGLGLLLRVTGPVPAQVAKEWGEWGLPLDALEVAAPDAAPPGRVRNLGQGRVALWPLTDVYRLALGGATPAFGSLWSDVLARVARARGGPLPNLPAAARVDERAVFCGLVAGVVIEGGDDAPVALLPDASGCAAYWPATAGWHTLSAGEARWLFHVRERYESPQLEAGENHRATEALVGATPPATAATTRRVPLPRWPFFLVFLAAVTALWLLERRSPPATPPPAT